MLTVLFYFFFKVSIDLILIGFVFFSTSFIYTWQRFAKIKSNQPFSGKRLDWMLKHSKWIIFVLFSSSILSFISIFLLQFRSLQILFPFGLIAFLYVGKFPFRRLMNLRDIPFLKAHLVALVWAVIAVVLPSMQAGVNLTGEVWIFFAAIYCFILSLAIIFDIRDVEMDEPEKRTIPQLVGKKGAAVVASAMNLTAVILMIFLRPELLFYMLLFTVLSISVFIVALTRKDDFYFSFWVDGLIVVFSCLIISLILFG